MNIKQDQSLIGYDSRELIEHGYGQIAVDVLRLEYLYSRSQRQAHSEVSQEQRNRIMKSVLDTIAGHFPCYQYNVPREMKYGSKDWALFFWCREAAGENDTAGDGRDYSYFTLTLNELYSNEKRKEVCDQVLRLLNTKFSDLSNLFLTIQYAALLDHQKIAKEVAQYAPKLNGIKWSYHGKEGRLVYTQKGLFFMEKYAKRKGYLLYSTDILKIIWQRKTTA